MAESLDKHFANLHPGRALGWFLLLFTAGATLTWLDEFTPWSPMVAVLSYGLVLLYSQRRFFVYLSDELKDSPYFMGYMLTLVALVRVFQLAIQGPTAHGGDNATLFHGVGSALTASAMGLLVRHMLISLDHTERSRTAVFQTLMDEVRTQATTLRDAQMQLVNLLNEFSSTREQFLSREERASAAYVERLEAGAGTLGGILRDYPASVASLTTSIASAAERIDAASRKTDALLERLQAEAATSLQSASAAQDVVMKLASERIGQADKAYAGVLSQLSQSTQNLRAELEQVATSLQALTREYGAAASAVSTLPSTLGEKVAQIATEHIAAQTNLKAHLASILSDVQQLDRIVDELARTLPGSLKELQRRT
jgi:hypothetical protein